MHEDLIIELARIVRECEQAVDRRIRSRQLGEAWTVLVDSRPIEGDEEAAA